ncbi:hypothetical protein [Aestuariibaculum lutulentum]|uniref:Uncharacterized protein n=1 Tax=Aestuariibaculum lutulentum TaxID=2920935 RepID=A0ABS9RKS9_9FLAO|nr:hypothetical protein [Aestuariibaculum lutulentum]MCH4553563.1 hypothetical protein [Aestuariibaculum lutulentum]
MGWVAKTNPLDKLSSDERTLGAWSDGIDKRVREISNFNFPFITKEYREGTIDDLISATELLVKDAKLYIQWLNDLKDSQHV